MKQPHCCNIIAHNIMASTIRCIEAKEALVRGCLAITFAVDPNSKASYQMLNDSLQEIADEIKARSTSGNPQGIMAHLNDVLFDESRFTLRANNESSVDSFLLPKVLKSGIGSQSLLAVVYCELLHRLGFNAGLVCIPESVLVLIDTADTYMIVDPSSEGRIVTPSEMLKIKSDFSLDRSLPRPFTLDTHQILSHIIVNLISVFRQEGQVLPVASLLELLEVIWPHQNMIQTYLNQHPDADLQERLGVTRAE